MRLKAKGFGDLRLEIRGWGLGTRDVEQAGARSRMGILPPRCDTFSCVRPRRRVHVTGADPPEWRPRSGVVISHLLRSLCTSHDLPLQYDAKSSSKGPLVAGCHWSVLRRSSLSSGRRRRTRDCFQSQAHVTDRWSGHPASSPAPIPTCPDPCLACRMNDSPGTAPSCSGPRPSSVHACLSRPKSDSCRSFVRCNRTSQKCLLGRRTENARAELRTQNLKP